MPRSASLGRRRRQLPAVLVIGLALAFIGALWSAAPKGQAADQPDQSMAVREGRSLYQVGCSSCHGLNAEGSNLAPSLIGVGAAAVDFQMTTGRMPLATQGPQALRGQQQFSQTQIDQIAAYIQSLGGGPTVPHPDVASGDLALGGELFRLNCAQCHNFIGEGGALTSGKKAPNLMEATPTQIQEAMRTGPGPMPVFAETQLDQHQADSIAKYVTEVGQNPKDVGGNGIGHLGPVPEGLVAWLVGIVGLVAVTLWIGARA